MKSLIYNRSTSIKIILFYYLVSPHLKSLKTCLLHCQLSTSNARPPDTNYFAALLFLECTSRSAINSVYSKYSLLYIAAEHVKSRVYGKKDFDSSVLILKIENYRIGNLKFGTKICRRIIKMINI